MSKRVAALSLVGMIVAPLSLAGCKGDDKEDVGDAGEADTGDTGTEDTGVELGPWEFGDVLGVTNSDDDDASGKRDWLEVPTDADDDIVEWVMPAEAFTGFAEGDQVELVLAGAQPEFVRFWHGTSPVLGHDVSEVRTTYVFTPNGEEQRFSVEFDDYNHGYALTVNHLDADGEIVATAEVEVRSAPLIMNHHLQPAEHFWVVDVGTNSAMINSYASALGSKFSPVAGNTVGYDVWIQDEIEFATQVTPIGRINIIIDSIRDRGLNSFPSQIIQPNIFKQTWGVPGTETSFDSFGNLEATPPITVDGVEYPFGRIYFGKTPQWGINDILADFLHSQTVQAPVEIDTTWLCVGHVDEFASFVPDPSSPKGFKVLLGDIDAGYELLESMDPNTSLPRYAADHGFATVGEIVDDANLRALNDDVRDDYLNPIRDQFKQEFALDDSDIISVPSIFEPVNGCGGAVVALIPGMANLIVANVEGEPTKLFIPDPFLRADNGDQGSDPLLTSFAASMPDGTESIFVDDWNTYHVALGEVHCGTNVLRTPIANWWEVATHLLD
ncbi:protein-arginine deiminase family protein [Enhygromyxa salina]|uniref:protein-arginine deiminase family protein n=1 Tax=Enhygromyxa salina TaxID=215803 RepID=UPI0006988942|nr:protein-arginine deiminase family protein [Enhygromyxa salina]